MCVDTHDDIDLICEHEHRSCAGSQRWAPTPDGLGVKDAAWVAGITALGVAAGSAVAGVLTFRLFTMWLPLAPGALTLRHLRHIGAV